MKTIVIQVEDDDVEPILSALSEMEEECRLQHPFNTKVFHSLTGLSLPMGRLDRVGKAAIAKVEEKVGREKLVLDVAGEIFGAMKRGGLREMETEMIASDDPKAIDDWIHTAGLHLHLFECARADLFETDGASDEFNTCLDEFDAALSGVINPQDHWTCDHCGRFFEGLDQPPRNQCPSDDCPSKDEPPGDTFKTSDGFVLTRKPRFWGNEFYWTDGDLSFRDVAGWPVDEDGGERLVEFKDND